LACWQVNATHVVTQVPLLHVWFGPHWPQLAVSPPQPSATCPHVALRLAQVAGAQDSVPHWPGTPAPPQLCPVGQEPQFSRLPQPSPIDPQLTPCATHVVGVHDGVTHSLFEHSWVELHGLPQSRTLPQPSDADPHTKPRLWHVCGVQVDTPHMFAPPPPQTCPATVQSPQWIVPPQPFG
jgi:hypothetical protein